MLLSVALGASSFLISGCHPPAPAKPKVTYYYQDADQAKSPNKPIEDPSKIAPLDTGNPPTAQLQKDQEKAEANFNAHPRDKKAKENFIYMTNRLAHGEMLDPNLDRKLKYREALKNFRKVLKVDPKNKDADTWATEIIQIYKSMHLPVPGD